jgi:hypothetical protein
MSAGAAPHCAGIVPEFVAPCGKGARGQKHNFTRKGGHNDNDR